MDFKMKVNADALKEKSIAICRKSLPVLGAAAVAVVAGSPDTFAALDLSGVSVDTTDYETIATFLIAALVGFWGIKKGMSLLGR